MRIALIHTRLLYRGGLETRLFSYIAYLRDLDHEVSVIVFRVGRQVEVPAGIRLIKVPLWWLPKVRRQAAFDQRLGKILRKENFDFVLSLGRTSHHDAVLLPGNHLGYLKALGQAPKSLSDRLQIEMDHAAYAAPGTILACSEMMKEEVVDLYGADPAKIQVLFPPSDTQRFHAGLKQRKSELREKFGMDPAKRSFVLVSASHSRKGLPLLTEAFKGLEDKGVELLVAGGEAVSSTLPHVRGIGFVRETEELYAAADCTLLPALYEPFGQVVSESILCGTPVMVSHMVGAKEVVGSNYGRVIESFDPLIWQKHILEFSPADYPMGGDFATGNRLSLELHMEHILKVAAAPRTDRQEAAT